MNHNARGVQAATIVGLGLVIAGGWLLATRLLGPLLAPLHALISALGHVTWPLVLIAIGALVIMQTRTAGTTGTTARPGDSRLYRSRTDRVFAGVIAGAASRFGISATALRVIYAVFTVMTGVWTGVLLYAIAAVAIPEQPFGEPAAAPTVPVSPAPPVPTAPSASQG